MRLHKFECTYDLTINSLDFHIRSGLNVFQAFTSYLKSKNAGDPTKEELLKELAALNEHIKTKVQTCGYVCTWMREKCNLIRW